MNELNWRWTNFVNTELKWCWELTLQTDELNWSWELSLPSPGPWQTPGSICLLYISHFEFVLLIIKWISLVKHNANLSEFLRYGVPLWNGSVCLSVSQSVTQKIFFVDCISQLELKTTMSGKNLTLRNFSTFFSTWVENDYVWEKPDT